MSTLEELREDARRDAAYEREEAAMPDICECGVRGWVCVGSDPAYGADADGRGGVRLFEWECRNCGALATT